jgi:hypothetical protein
MNSSRASVLELLRGLLTSWEVLRPSERRLSLYSRRMNLGALLGAKPHSLHTFYRGEHRGIYRSKAVLWPKVGRMGPTWQAGRPCNFSRWPRSLPAPPFPHWILHLPTCFDTWWKWVLEMCQHMAGRPKWCGRPATPWLSWACALCHVISSCRIVCDYALFWT